MAFLCFHLMFCVCICFFHSWFPGQFDCGNKYVVTKKLYLKSWKKALACKCIFLVSQFSIGLWKVYMISFVRHAISLIQYSTKMKQFEWFCCLYLESNSLISLLHDKSHSSDLHLILPFIRPFTCLKRNLKSSDVVLKCNHATDTLLTFFNIR